MGRICYLDQILARSGSFEARQLENAERWLDTARCLGDSCKEGLFKLFFFCCIRGSFVTGNIVIVRLRRLLLLSGWGWPAVVSSFSKSSNLVCLAGWNEAFGESQPVVHSPLILRDQAHMLSNLWWLIASLSFNQVIPCGGLLIPTCILTLKDRALISCARECGPCFICHFGSVSISSCSSYWRVFIWSKLIEELLNFSVARGCLTEVTSMVGPDKS